ncbi:hypothetical protein CONPUDRAFT_162679 [Coniophora puteana RWD-64-598 SS2]|uniref:F-box domain-containing protein n=1 Tax=Coniophora puteana (strain RWD-64-598) TaxID=741705 RepID=A0A5M3N281_CONPW|nr:uncharacterized protein CONPUDRAFT_162679 [Coniophora puteana RWD-64-598 SS2]EIW85493.1 hypothetical protein CONPUDRAFT_162679 [Coniophora puteana RWD-64-598 SS2]
MHRALSISEVVHTIASYHSEKKDLTALARTCREFSEPALDTLWWELDDLTPLLRCLPQDLVSCGETELVRSGVYSLRREFTTADWTIFRKNAARVRVLNDIVPDDENNNASDSSDWVDVISDDVFEALCRPPASDKPLFPKLRTLMWRKVQPEGFDFLELLLSPTITRLDITPHSSSTRVLRLAAKLSVLCPHLRHFTWIFPGLLDSTSTAKAIATLSQTVVSWPNLNDVACHYLNAEAIRHLSSLPSIGLLVIAVNDATYPALHVPAFSGASDVYIQTPPGHTLSAVVPLIRAGQWSPTEFFVGTGMASASSIRHLSEALSGHFDRATLKTLKIDEWDDRTPGITLCTRDLEPLFAFGSLTSLRVDTRREVELDDTALLHMADAWPHLVSLRLNERSGWRRRSAATLHAVRGLLQRLPRLADLAVAVDCERVAYDALGDALYGRVRAGARRVEVNLLDSRIGGEHHAEVAAFLADVVPEMTRSRDLSAWGWREEEEEEPVGLDMMERVRYWERWWNVAATVVMINRIRKRDRGEVDDVVE